MFSKNNLVIYDDVFPYLLSGFRIAEYNFYLKNINKVVIYSDAKNFDQYKKDYLIRYPEFSKNIKKLETTSKIHGSLLYTIFLNNVYNILPTIEKSKIPFVFTLYPGGGFWINQKESDDKLLSVCSSKFLKKIFVTQDNTYKYLLSKKFCTKDKIKYVYGGVLASDFYKKNTPEKITYPNMKPTLDVCFVANKYMKKGKDKGYDVFIECANILSEKADNIRFHVVGGGWKDEINTEQIKDKITFYDTVFTEFFPKFYSNMDIICSPNKPYILTPGAFDGFPTGSCIEAGLSGVAVLCSDELKMNKKFTNKKDIYVIPLSARKIADIILNLNNNPKQLYLLSKHCKESFNKVFDIDRQMNKRCKTLKMFIK